MLYQVTRNGQTYGPYTLQDLERYVASGNVLPTDLAKSDEMPAWVPVAQILGAHAVPASSAYPLAPAPYAPGAAAAPGTPVAYPGAMPFPDPPNLHWALVLVIGIFTCGLFVIVWEIVQAAWMRKITPRSNALFFYLGFVVVYFGGTISRIFLMAATAFRHSYLGLGVPVGLISLVLIEFAFFDMRRSMEEHFNGPEPVGLTLSPVMTFFFGPYYFQYHFSRINEMKRIARYRGASI